MTKTDLRLSHPKLYNEIFEDGRQAGIVEAVTKASLRETLAAETMVQAATEWRERNHGDRK